MSKAVEDQARFSRRPESFPQSLSCEVSGSIIQFWIGGLLAADHEGMRMSEGVTVTVAWAIKPGFADTFVETYRGMFAETRLREGFRNVRLLRSNADPSHFLLIEEWDGVQNFHDHAQFRTRSGDMKKLLAMTVSPPQLGIWILDPLATAQA